MTSIPYSSPSFLSARSAPDFDARRLRPTEVELHSTPVEPRTAVPVFPALEIIQGSHKSKHLSDRSLPPHSPKNKTKINKNKKTKKYPKTKQKYFYNTTQRKQCALLRIIKLERRQIGLQPKEEEEEEGRQRRRRRRRRRACIHKQLQKRKNRFPFLSSHP